MFSVSRIAALLVVVGTALHTVSAHGLVTQVKGANGKVGIGFGVVTSTPRTGTTAKPFQARYYRLCNRFADKSCSKIRQ